ncbi:hypothetical protein [Streptomyces coffeae]|uniref:Uncharacterized protein n=1 Tax=Streptomyces coffeae TaxID=621382 RepID=A0ABS1NN99_9ACTN|nr:hypothetical protein [Streptomyces coffeae]MBL1101499.1 hypothetical protein [Streptomyces coffeae]
MRAVVDAGDETFLVGLTERASLRRRHGGRVVPPGDAAYPAFPTIGQGTVRIVEDAMAPATRLSAR